MQVELNGRNYTVVKEVCLLGLEHLAADILDRGFEPKEYYLKGVKSAYVMAWKSLKTGKFLEVI